MNMKRIPILVLCVALIPLLKAADPAPAPDDSKLELAREVIKSMHADRMFDQMSGQMQRMAAQAMNASGADMTPQQKAAAEKVSSQVMALSMDSAKSLLANMDVIYAQVYSTAELRAMKAFFESPEGMSMLEKQPVIVQKLTPYVLEMQRDLMPKIRKITEDARAEEQGATAAPAAPAAPVSPAAPVAPAAKP
jgi:hypothetical protein